VIWATFAGTSRNQVKKTRKYYDGYLISEGLQIDYRVDHLRRELVMRTRFTPRPHAKGLSYEGLRSSRAFPRAIAFLFVALSTGVHLIPANADEVGVRPTHLPSSGRLPAEDLSGTSSTLLPNSSHIAQVSIGSDGKPEDWTSPKRFRRTLGFLFSQDGTPEDWTLSPPQSGNGGTAPLGTADVGKLISLVSLLRVTLLFPITP